MRELVDMAIEGHGGLDQWCKVRHVSVDFVAHGQSFKAHGSVGNAVANATVLPTVKTRKQEVSFEGWQGFGNKRVYEPNRTVIRDADGAIVEALGSPRESLTQMIPGTPRTGPQLLYFPSYSIEPLVQGGRSGER